MSIVIRIAEPPHRRETYGLPCVCFSRMLLPAEYRITSFKVDGDIGHVGNCYPVSDEAVIRAFHCDTVLYFGSPRLGCYRHHRPQHMPVRRPVKSEPPLGLVRLQRATNCTPTQFCCCKTVGMI